MDNGKLNGAVLCWAWRLGQLILALGVLFAVAEWYLGVKQFETHEYREPLTPWREQHLGKKPFGGETRACRELVWKNRKYKILLTGCSFAYGIGVPQTKTFAWHLQSLLPSCTIDDFGIPGAGAVQSINVEQLLLRHRHYDLVLYCSIRNHLEREPECLVTWEAPANVTSTTGADTAVYACQDSANNVVYRLYNLDSYWPGEDLFRTINFLRAVSLQVHWKAHLLLNHNYAFDRMTALLRVQRIIAEENGSKFCAVNFYKFSDSERNAIASQKLFPGDSTPPVLFVDAAYPVDYVANNMCTAPGEMDAGDHPNCDVHHYYAHRILDILRVNKLLPEAAFSKNLSQVKLHCSP